MTLAMIVLSAIFAIAKVAGSLSWPWFFVTAPLWGWFLFCLCLLIEIPFWQKVLNKEKQSTPNREPGQ